MSYFKYPHLDFSAYLPKFFKGILDIYNNEVKETRLDIIHSRFYLYRYS